MKDEIKNSDSINNKSDFPEIPSNSKIWQIDTMRCESLLGGSFVVVIDSEVGK